MINFTKKIEFKVTVFVGLYILISLPVALYLNNFLHIFMGWNLILALIPLYGSMLFNMLRHKNGQSKSQLFVLIVLFLGWLFFLPNTFYVITDLIHLGNRDFYFQSSFYMPWDYVEDIKNYVALTHIFIGAIISLTAGVISLSNMEDVIIEKYHKIIGYSFVVFVLFLSSIAIYIGRFLRFNSWDMLRPFHLLATLYKSVDLFFVQFVLLFWFVQVCVYFFYRIISLHKEGDLVG
jgi:uncharacterized membrane protein